MCCTQTNQLNPTAPCTDNQTNYFELVPQQGKVADNELGVAHPGTQDS